MLFYLVVTSLLVSFASSACPAEFASPFQGKCYLFFDVTATYEGAEQACTVKQRSIRLVVRDAAEASHINDMLAANTEIWNGGEYSADQELFVDFNGIPLPHLNWASVYPTSAKTDTCVTMLNTEHRNFPCTDMKRYICVLDEIVIPCEDGWTKLSDDGPCVKAVKKYRKTFSRARKACQDMGGDLATSVASREHRNLIQATIPFRAHFWIGIHDEEPNGVFTQIDSVTLTEKPFKKGRPRANGPQCVTMKMKRWYDRKCNKYHHYICQKPLTTT